MSTRSRSKRPTKRTRTSRSKSTARRSLSYSGARATRTVALAAPSVGLGTSATTVLRTSFFANVTSAGTGIWTGYLKPGSCFDPCGDIADVQPQMFDQFAAMYQRYKVNSYTLRINIHGTNGGGVINNYVAASYPAVDPTALATYQAAASQQYAKTVSGGFQVTNAIGLGNPPTKMYFKFNHASVVGTRPDAYDNGALVTADPTALQYAVQPIFIQASFASVVNFMLEIDIFQNVTFSQKKNTVDA